MGENQADMMAAMAAQMKAKKADAEGDPVGYAQALIDNPDMYKGGARHITDIANDPQTYGTELANAATNAAVQMAAEKNISGPTITQAMNRLKSLAEQS